MILIEWAAVGVLSTQQKEKLSASLFISLIAAVALALGRENLSVWGKPVREHSLCFYEAGTDDE